MRFLHTADLHLGKTLEGRARWPEQVQVLAEIRNLAAAHDVDLVLLAGDIYDSFNPPAEAEKLLYAWLRELSDEGRRAVVLIAGNHDQPQRLSAAAPLAQGHGIYIVGLPGQLPEPDAPQPGRVCLTEARDHLLRLRLPRVAEEVALIALPYCSEARLQELYLRDLSDEAAARADYQQRLSALLAEAGEGFRAESINLVMTHLFLSGGVESTSERPLGGAVPSVGGSYGVRAAIFPPLTQYVALGHLHRPQELGGDLPCVYSGSPLAYSFSEAGQAKSVIIGEAQAGQPVTWQRVLLESGCPLSVWRARDYAEALSWCEDEAKREVWVNLEIPVEQPLSAEQVAALRQAHPKLLAVRGLLPELELEQEVSANLGIEERFRLFVAQQTGAEANEALVGLFMTLLAQEQYGTPEAAAADGEVFA